MLDPRAYFETFEPTTTLKNRLEIILRDFAALVDEPVKHFFVSEMLDAAGNRLFGNMFLFTDNYLFEVESWVSKFAYFLVRFPRSVETYVANPVEFDFKTASPTSRLVVRGTLVFTQYTLEMNATGANCLRLAEICNAVLRPNLASR